MKAIMRALAIAALVLPFSAQAAGANELTEATVKKVDKAAGKVTLAHGPIANLGMGAMTMTFKAKEPAMLKTVKAGDQVRIRVEDVGGALTLVRIEAAK